MDDKDRLANIVNNITIGVVVHARDTTIIMHNPKAAELLGLPDKRIKGSLATDDQWEFISKDSTPMLLQDYPVNQVLSTKNSVENIIIGIVHKDSSHNIKEVRWVLANGFPVFDSRDEIEEITITFSDVTELILTQNAAEEAVDALALKNKELEAILEYAPNPIIIHNERGDIIKINSIWKKLTGYTYEDINTIEKWTTKAYGKKMSVVKENIDKLYLLNQKVDEGEYEIMTKSGEKIIWQFSSAPLGYIDGARTVITSAMDITQLREKDKMLHEQSRLAQMGEMLSMIAHQWRQPLSAIGSVSSNAQLRLELKDINFKDEASINQSIETFKGYCNDIDSYVKNLSTTIDDFRNFYKPNKSSVTIKLTEVISKSLNIIKRSIVNDSIEIIEQFNVKESIELYENEMMQVVLNILKNAQDNFHEKKVESPKITITAEDRKMTICDNGGGIPKEIILKVFDPYFSTKNEKNGSGLGLYMSKIIVEEHHGGTFIVENRGSGTCFIITLPQQ